MPRDTTTQSPSFESRATHTESMPPPPDAIRVDVGSSLANRVTYYTTMAGAEAATEALKHKDDLAVISLQEMHAELG